MLGVLCALGVYFVRGNPFDLMVRQGLILTRGNFLAFFTGHPIALVLGVLTLIALSVPLIRGLMDRRRNA